MWHDMTTAPTSSVVWGHAGWGHPMTFLMRYDEGRWWRRIHETYWAPVEPVLWGGRR